MLSICCIWRKTTYDDGFKLKENRNKRWKNWPYVLERLSSFAVNGRSNPKGVGREN